MSAGRIERENRLGHLLIFRYLYQYRRKKHNPYIRFELFRLEADNMGSITAGSQVKQAARRPLSIY
jgi:hypothetical protein